MKVLIINGMPGDDSYVAYEEAIENAVKSNKELDIDYFLLRKMKINYCTGCWDCWLKTPGLCAIKDDQEQILSRFPNVDKILYISPIILGYESSLLKTCKDRTIPVIHPYISIYMGEQHHKQRYKKMPDLNVLLIKDNDSIDEDVKIIQESYERIALNFRSSLNYFEAIDEIGGIDHVLSCL